MIYRRLNVNLTQYWYIKKIDKMNLLEILKKIFSCAMPQAASEGDMDSVSPSDKTNDWESADLKSAASKNGMQDKGMGIANPQV